MTFDLTPTMASRSVRLPDRRTLAAFLAGGGLVVTPTRRLRRHVLAEYARTQQEQGRTAWSTPAVRSWNEWLTDNWRQLEVRVAAQGQPLPMLLTDAQETWLWGSVIQDSLGSRPDYQLLHLSATAGAAAEAWRLLWQWQIAAEGLDDGNNEDVRAFNAWVRDFRSRCVAQQWQSTAALTDTLASAVGGLWRPIGPLWWLGFDDFTPAQIDLFERLTGAGVDVRIAVVERPPGEAVVVACRDPRDEMERAAGWARALLERGEPGPIGVVFDDLRPIWDRVERVFRTVLATDGDDRDVFHLSMGKPLGDYPIIADALTVLRYLAGPRPMREMSRLLRSPFLRGGVHETAQRGALDWWLRSTGRDRLGIDGLGDMLATTEHGCPVLADGLAGVRRLASGLAAVAAPSVWSEIFTQWLRRFGWPGDRALANPEYQAVEAWRDTLGRFAALGAVVPALTLGDALAIWLGLVQRCIFQADSTPAPVQVMGLVEAGGVQFTHLWLAGMSDDRWPPPLRPNPFLPHPMQRRLKLPGASAQQTLDAAERATVRLLHSAPRIVVSYPCRRDQQPVGLSPLFGHLARRRAATLQISDVKGYARQVQNASPGLEAFADHCGPPVTESESFTGGVGVFRDQAACPFRAFARHRLRLSPPPKDEPGLSAAERGQLVHRCLAGIWASLRDQGILLGLSAADQATRIDKVVSEVMAPPRIGARDRFRAAFLALERQRLTALLAEWLDVERTREPFQVVAVEHPVTVDLAGVEMRLRIDRVDETVAGIRLVIDYKTGRDVGVKQWFGDRPDDPQLPIYAVTLTPPPGALAVGQVRRGACTLTGLGVSALAPAIEAFDKSRYSGESDWNGQTRRWQGVLERLGGEFVAGDARVDPKRPQACRYCEVWAVCRVFEGSGTVERRA